MKKDEHAFIMETSDSERAENGFPDLGETLQRVDRILAEFYEIHGSHIKDQGQNP